MKILSIKLTSWVLLAIFPIFVLAQDDSGSGFSDFGGDPFEGIDEGSIEGLQWDSEIVPEQATDPEPVNTEVQEAKPEIQTQGSGISQPSVESAVEYAPLGMDIEESVNSEVQNAIIEGIQLSTEDTDVPNEKIITGYFIFRDKPSSYFYEVKLREKKIIFEFNDTRTGSSPVPTASEPPILGFKIVQDKVDVNKEVKGLKPEWHDLIRVTFNMEDIPQIHVNDEYSVISFSFKWTTDQAKLSQYIVKDNTPKVILWSSIGVAGIGLGVAGYFIFKPESGPPELKSLANDDLPEHKFPTQ